MNYWEFDKKSSAILHGVVCLAGGISIAAGRVIGLKPSATTYFCAAFVIAAGLMFISSAREPEKRINHAEGWAMWFVFGGMATLLANVVF
jgi:hypothetical protein